MIRIALLLTLAAPLAAFADSPDSSFYKHAAEAGIAEVQDGQLAQNTGSSQQVKDFGAKMVTDHGAANDKLKSIADSKGVTLPTSPSIGQMATMRKLKMMSGDSFDKSYIKSQITAHRKTIALFKKEIASGQDSDAKSFAQATLPTVQSHYQMIKSIAAGAGITS